LDQHRLEELIQRYSEFITFPISLYKSKTETVDLEDEEEEDDSGDAEEASEGGDDLAVEDEEDEYSGEEEEKKKTETVTKWSWERIKCVRT
jgi:heat shock protein beta